MSQQLQLQRVNIHELLEKMQSKKEVYNFLSLSGEAYLPKLDTINVYFLKQIARGQKDVRNMSFDTSSMSNDPMSKCQQCPR